jgi:hypothetical protein
MTQRIAATMMTLGVAIATVASALLLAGLDESEAAQQDAPAPTKTAEKVGVTIIQKVEVKAVAPPVQIPGGTTTVTVTRGVMDVPVGKAQEQPVRVLKAAPAPRTVATRRPAQAAAAIAREVQMVKMQVAMGNNQAQQFIQQFRPILRSEYHIVRVVCRPTPEQRQQIARAGEQAMRDAAVKYVDMMRRPMTAAQRAALDPRKQIREGLARSVKAVLSAELASRLKDEMVRRDASRQQLAVRNLVARLDHDLILSPDQRDKVAESLRTHWDDSWGQSLEMFMYDYQFMPPIPDQHVAPFLNDSQKKVWRGTQKVQTFWGGFGMVGGVMADDPLEDDELRVARQEAARNEPNPAPNQPGMIQGEVIMMPAAPMMVDAPAAAPALKVIRKKAAPPPQKAQPKATTKATTKTAVEFKK